MRRSPTAVDPGRFTCAIRVQSPTITQSAAGAEVTWRDVGVTDNSPRHVAAQWVTDHGVQSLTADAVAAGDLATVTWWYRPGIDDTVTPACRIVRESDKSQWEITSIEDVRQLRMLMVCRVRRLTAG